MAKPKTIDQLTAEYRNRLVRRSMTPQKQPTPADRERRLLERIERTELQLGKSDQRRLRILIRQARLLVERDDMRALYAVTLEIGHICRVRVIGLQEVHPVLSSRPPSHALVSTIPPHGATPGVTAGVVIEHADEVDIAQEEQPEDSEDH